MRSVAITGVSGALGRRVVASLAERGGWSVVGIDRGPFPAAVAKPRHFTVHLLDLATSDLVPLLDGCDSLIHLATVDPDDPDAVHTYARVTARVLDAAASAGITSAVVLSSATVYGAWADNPVPLTEEAALRPNPDFGYALQKTELERVAAEWGAAHPGSSVAVLRPANTLGHPSARAAWVARALRPSLLDRLGGTLPALQYLHIDDLSSAVVHALEQRLDGAFNVAPDDWIAADDVADLLGPGPRLPLPDPVIDRIRRLAELRPGRRRPTGSLAYRRRPWVVANDRLEATGWSPRSTSAEALVASRRPSSFGRVFARHRQEVTLAAVALAGLALLLGAFGVGRAVRRRRRR